MAFSDRLTFPVIFFAILFSACRGKADERATIPDNRTRAEIIVDSAIVYNGVLADTLILGFTFRDKAYSISNAGGHFKYTVQYPDKDVRRVGTLTNTGYTETVNGGWASLSPKDSASRAENLNSVVYFVTLPSRLNDAAVKKHYEGEETIKGKNYYRIKVTFEADGGGKDHDDVYLYWFDQDDFSMDYLAYSFSDNDGGTRFRSVIKSRRLNGIVFQDYENFTGPSPDSLQYISGLFNQGALRKLSDIELTKISIRLSNGEGR